MTIGQLAERAGVNIETIRYYERRGLLPDPDRTPSGYRRYEDDTVARLRFIRRAQGLGFTLREVADLLALRVRHPGACKAASQRTREKLSVVQQEIRELETMARSLTWLAEACDAGRQTGDCPILHALEDAEDPRTA